MTGYQFMKSQDQQFQKTPAKRQSQVEFSFRLVNLAASQTDGSVFVPNQSCNKNLFRESEPCVGVIYEPTAFVLCRRNSRTLLDEDFLVHSSVPCKLKWPWRVD